jgi:hypothetical protein
MMFMVPLVLAIAQGQDPASGIQVLTSCQWTKIVGTSSWELHHSSLLEQTTKQVFCVGGMAGIEPTQSKSNNWTLL